MFTSKQFRSSRAFTLVELSMAMAVSGVILTALISFTVYAAKSFAGIYNYVDLEQRSQAAIDSMLRDVRETQFLSGYGTTTLNGRTITNRVSFVDSANQTLTFHFTNNTLRRTRGIVSTEILKNVDYLNFQMFQRVPIGGTFDQFPLANTATNCKLISVSWICSRTIVGSKLNTESVQTAKIVIRKQ